MASTSSFTCVDIFVCASTSQDMIWVERLDIQKMSCNPYRENARGRLSVR